MYGCQDVAVLDDKMDARQTEEEQKLDVKAKGTNFQWKLVENQLRDKAFVDKVISTPLGQRDPEGNVEGHVLDSRSDMEVYSNGKIADTANEHFETLSWATVIRDHKLATTASETSLKIRSSDNKDAQITFVGDLGAFVLKCFAEHYGYTNTSVCIVPTSEWISADQMNYLKAQQITDDIY